MTKIWIYWVKCIIIFNFPGFFFSYSSFFNCSWNTLNNIYGLFCISLGQCLTIWFMWLSLLSTLGILHCQPERWEVHGMGAGRMKSLSWKSAWVWGREGAMRLTDPTRDRWEEGRSKGREKPNYIGPYEWLELSPQVAWAGKGWCWGGWSHHTLVTVARSLLTLQ